GQIGEEWNAQCCVGWSLKRVEALVMYRILNTMDITRTITGRDNRDMVSSIGEVVCQPMGYFWHTADHGRVLIGDDHDTHGYRSILVGTRGGVGPGGGLVLVLCALS